MCPLLKSSSPLSRIEDLCACPVNFYDVMVRGSWPISCICASKSLFCSNRPATYAGRCVPLFPMLSNRLWLEYAFLVCAPLSGTYPWNDATVRERCSPGNRLRLIFDLGLGKIDQPDAASWSSHGNGQRTRNPRIPPSIVHPEWNGLLHIFHCIMNAPGPDHNDLRARDFLYALILFVGIIPSALFR